VDGDLVGRHVATDVIEDGRLARIVRVLRGEDGLERLVLDVHGIARVLAHPAVHRDDHGNGIADVSHLVRRKRPEGRAREVVELDPQRLRLRRRAEFLSGDDRDDAGRPPRGIDVDRRDPRMGKGAANEDGLQHPRPPQVCDIAGAAAQDPSVLETRDADAEHVVRTDAHWSSAARSTPSTML